MSGPLCRLQRVCTSGKQSTCQCRRCKRLRFDPCIRKIPWSRKWQCTIVFLPGKFHRQRSLAGYSPRGHKSIWYDSATEQPYTGKRDYFLHLKDRGTQNIGRSLSRRLLQIQNVPNERTCWVWETQLCYSYCHLIILFKQACSPKAWAMTIKKQSTN